ncbi:MAG: hypothetical protein CEN89_453, partial [Candidatus Berkelbacteria bacterium Licking1014_7]
AKQASKERGEDERGATLGRRACREAIIQENIT